ncbi:MAG: ABC transporter permease subunit [Clostridiaceae bacterium]|nr:ABC transporter permease subunit [Clostridiaceae bacterium]
MKERKSGTLKVRAEEKRTPLAAVRREFKNCGMLWAILIPGLIILILFKIAPLFGLVIAFEKYSTFKGVFGSEWVGFANFRQILSDPYTWKVVKNTILLAFWTLVVSFPIPVIFALLLNEMKGYRFKKMVQSISFFPYFISVAVAVSILTSFTSPSDGILNLMLNKMGIDSVHFMAESGWFRPLYVFLHVWQNFGYAAIVYISAMTSIDPGLYEAASIDGAGRWKKILHITIPALVPIIVTMFIVNLGSILSVDINKVLLMQNPSTYETSDVLQTYVYRMAFGSTGFPQYSLGTALSLLQSLIAFALVMTTNWISNKVADTGAF